MPTDEVSGADDHEGFAPIQAATQGGPHSAGGRRRLEEE